MTEVSVTIDLTTKVFCDDFRSQIVMIFFQFAVTLQTTGHWRAGIL